MSITQPSESESSQAVPVKRNRSVVKQVGRLMGKVLYPVRVATGMVYTLSRTRKPRVKVSRSVGLPGLIKFFVDMYKETWTRGIDVPVIHLRNEQDRDDRGQRLPIGMEIIRAAYAAGMVILGGKHMYDRRLMPLLSRTFPRAVDGAAYIRGLGSPTIGNGMKVNIPFVMKDITSFNSKGQVIHAGSDGAGRIHPAHHVLEGIGGSCPIQIRIENFATGVFIKGILVPDERCVDAEGRPDIWVDWLQIKGKHKDLAKSRQGFATGAFCPKTKVLVDRSKLREQRCCDGYLMGILQKWDRKGKIKWCFEILERVEDSETNRAYVRSFLKEGLDDLEEKGGLAGILADKALDDRKLDLIVQFCEKLTESSGTFVDPLRVPYVWDFVQDELQRKLYHFRQGAGKRSLRYVAVIDNGVPPGHIVLRQLHDDGAWRFRHGDKVASTRFPMLMPSALKVLTVIDPRKCEHLDHLLIKTDKGRFVTPWVAYYNEADLVDDMQGDDDGDTTLIDYDPRVVDMYESKLALIPGTESDSFLIEPGKVGDSWKSAVALVEQVERASSDSFEFVGKQYRMSEKALKILGTDGRGPVGQLTYYCSMFLALNMRMHALACAVLIQEAIDAAKHIIELSDPNKLANRKNWKQDAEGRWSPIDCKADVGGVWYDENDHLNMETFAEWAGLVTNGAKMADVLTWRPSSGEKKLRDGDGMQQSGYGENLVHYNAHVFDHYWSIWKSENIKSSPRVELKHLLPMALGLPSFKSADPDSRFYKELMVKSGLPKFGQKVKGIRNEGLEPEERNSKIEAEQDLLVQTLRGLSKVELLTLWVTELTSASVNSENPKTHMNRAFRAVMFEGSPILDDLGIEMKMPCQYLAGGSLDAFFGKLQGHVANGDVQDILYAVVEWDRFTEDHEELTGTPASECDHCRKLLHSKAVTHIRNSKEGNGRIMTKRVGEICNTMNGILQEKK